MISISRLRLWRESQLPKSDKSRLAGSPDGDAVAPEGVAVAADGVAAPALFNAITDLDEEIIGNPAAASAAIVASLLLMPLPL